MKFLKITCSVFLLASMTLRLLYPLSVVFADSLNVTITPNQNDRTVTLSVTGLPANAKTVWYELTYTSNNLTKGVKAGPIDITSQTQWTRSIYLGTCSQNVCTPDPDVSNGSVRVDVGNADGTTQQVSGQFSFSGETTIQNQTSVVNDISSTASSGGNVASSGGQIVTPSATEAASPSASVISADAISLAQGENSLNTTSINAQVVNQTLNIFIPQTNNINVTIPSSDVLAAIIAGHPQDATISALITGVNSFAYLTNSINSLANTGGNSVDTAGSATVQTGDAYSIVSLLNKVNTTFIDSVIHFITVNIFTHVVGNILLPEAAQTGSGCCGKDIKVENAATVTNTITSLAHTGTNSVTTSGSALIVTGAGKSAINVLNLVNQTFIDASVFDLWINTLGGWNGNFRGWNSLGPVAGGGTLAVQGLAPQEINGSGCSTCTGDIQIANNANVANTIGSRADTGNNHLTARDGRVTSGNAYSSVSLINLVNTTFIRTLGWFGFVNIFGSLDGDIGGASLFPTPTPSPTPTPGVGVNTISDTTVQTQSSPTNTQSPVHDTGGLFAMTQSNNVGEFIYPGDTVTFFIKAKNIGSGRVYNTKVDLLLIKDGLTMGGASFAAGTVDPGKGVKITTGLVLAKNAAPGPYIARAIVHGVVGPDDHMVSASADSTFTIWGKTVPAQTGSVQGSSTGGTQPQVMGIQQEAETTRMENKMILALGILTGMYVSMEAVKRRRQLLLTFYKASYCLRLFL